jgi:hypothetical protein
MSAIFIHCPKHERSEVLSEVDVTRFIENVCVSYDRDVQLNPDDVTCPVEFLESL